METSRKKVLEKMQKALVSYYLISERGWDVSDHYGDGYDLIAEKNGQYIRIELKAIDLSMIEDGKRATQYLSANEIVSASHLIITVFKGIKIESNYIMSIRDFVENSGVKKYKKYKSFEEFEEKYKKLVKAKSQQVKNSGCKKSRLAFDFSFNPSKIEKWKLFRFKNHWGNIELQRANKAIDRTPGKHGGASR
jgi:hypothetical protein